MYLSCSSYNIIPGTNLQKYARSEHHTQRAKMNFDEIFDLTPGVCTYTSYIFFYSKGNAKTTAKRKDKNVWYLLNISMLTSHMVFDLGRGGIMTVVGAELLINFHATTNTTAVVGNYSHSWEAMKSKARKKIPGTN